MLVPSQTLGLAKAICKVTVSSQRITPIREVWLHKRLKTVACKQKKGQWIQRAARAVAPQGAS